MTTFIVVITVIISIKRMIVKRHLRSERVPRLSTECPHKCSLLTKGENKGADDVFVAPTPLYICQKGNMLERKIFNFDQKNIFLQFVFQVARSVSKEVVSISCHN